ncbi:TonB-dependent receptor domain-containing protein [Alteromonas sp. RKMC-009]|uniref:TonB-dependent receptor domain-containing protein n=1 Tax=Alteromonas sp. RKMC-009 TaxID=2267264 RepID=UPI000E67FC6E|nr:TonB-dependent receptor [Alteromonas sp. RKMC-009]AYA63347.1 TonB-dependent receptor [Alteromonas sp. RKMC-009]
MKHTLTRKKHILAMSVLSAIAASTSNAFAEEMAAESREGEVIEEIQVIGRSVSYANNATDENMKQQQTAMTSVLATIDNLPGVLINEGDTFGADDWSTSISIRGFQVDLDQQQIGMTVDGIANGNSNYGGGSKANRYMDTENLRAVEVSQGTADIASRSNEALGGTLNFTTINPGTEEGLILSGTLAEYEGQKIYARYETGELVKDTYAWVSVSSQDSSDWMDQAAENTRDHFAAKVISYVSGIDFTGYASYDDTHEDNYQRIYGNEQFAQNPEWDQLTSDWSGVPYQDQAYRRGWSTLRENFFTYLKADMSVGAVDFSANVYYHNQEGRGDWLPPYVVDVTDDGLNQPNSELVSGNTVYGGSQLGQLFYVSPEGAALSPATGCVSSLKFPYGGSSAEYDPACYDSSAVPVGSYRHTHYKKERTGFNADMIWNTQIGDMDNVLRAGLWYEDYNREESRDWHKIIDSKTSFYYDHIPYWVQYSREFPVETIMYYLEDELDLGVAKVRLGAKQFNVDVKKNDLFDANNNQAVSSDSDVLFSAGFVAPLADNLEFFGGFAQNYAAIKDAVLERDDADLSVIEPETADNIDLGVRYSTPGFNASLTYYTIKFDNRIRFVSAEQSEGIDFLEEGAGGYVNDGGVESDGIEASAQWQATEYLSVYASYTYNNSEYAESRYEDIEGNTVLGTAKDMAVLSLDYAKSNYIAGLSTKYVGPRFMDQANLTEVEEYVVSDFYAGVVLDNVASGIKSLDVRLTVNNLFDESYLGTVVAGAGWIGAPRTAAINVKAAF